MRVVLDTNVIVSGLNFPGNERLVLELARRGRFELYLSPFILEEVAGVLHRKFGWSEERVSQVIHMLGDEATVIEPKLIPKVIEDYEADNRILGCVVEASADYLVTGGPTASLTAGEVWGRENTQRTTIPFRIGAVIE